MTSVVGGSGAGADEMVYMPLGAIQAVMRSRSRPCRRDAVLALARTEADVRAAPQAVPAEPLRK